MLSEILNTLNHLKIQNKTINNFLSNKKIAEKSATASIIGLSFNELVKIKKIHEEGIL